jgi:hypothetical protein
MPIVAWYVLSNESYMKRVINDVFPTVAAKLAFPPPVNKTFLRKSHTTLLAQKNKPVSN